MFTYTRKKGSYINRHITSLPQYLHEVVYRFRLQIENVSYDADIANRIDVVDQLCSNSKHFIRTSCLFVFGGDFIFPTQYVFVCECCFKQLREQSERVNMFSYTGIFFSHSDEFETCIVLLCHAVYTDTIKNQNRETLCAIVLR